MAKFNKYDFVKFKEEYCEKCRVGLPCNPMIVMDIVKVDGETEVYDLMDWIDFSKHGAVPDDWLEPTESPIPLMTALPITGLTISADEVNKFSVKEEKATVSILGTTYTVETRKVSEDEYMKEKHLSGYCCEESKRIVIADMSEKEYFELDEAEQKSYYKKTLRHELLHAFLNESGLSDDASVPAGAWAKHEEMVDWFAIQSPKIYKTFAELDIL